MRTLTPTVLMFAIASSCAQRSADNNLAQLMKIHNEARDSHFQKNAKAMVAGQSDDMFSVSRAKILKAKGPGNPSGFQEYFDAVEFKKWDDIQPPEIRFSDDHSLAY